MGIISIVSVLVVTGVACSGDGDSHPFDDGGVSPPRDSGPRPSSDGQRPSSDDSGSPSSDTGGETAEHPEGPRIVSLTTNAGVLEDGDSLVVTVVVTDPDGNEDLIGGELRSGSGSTYGALQDASGEGVYSISLAWSEMSVVEPVHGFAEQMRGFRVHVFDRSAHEASRGFEVRLSCSGDSHLFCDNSCVNLETNREHCGSCDAPVGEEQVCRSGVPDCERSSRLACGDECRFGLDGENCGACDNNCAENAVALGGDNAVCNSDPSSPSPPAEEYYCNYRIASDDTTQTCAEVCSERGLLCLEGYSSGVSGRQLTCSEMASEDATLLCRCRDP